MSTLNDEVKEVRNWLRATDQRLSDHITGSTQDITAMRSRLNLNDRNMERMAAMASLTVSIGTFVVLIWKTFH